MEKNWGDTPSATLRNTGSILAQHNKLCVKSCRGYLFTLNLDWAFNFKRSVAHREYCKDNPWEGSKHNLGADPSSILEWPLHHQKLCKGLTHVTDLFWVSRFPPLLSYKDDTKASVLKANEEWFLPPWTQGADFASVSSPDAELGVLEWTTEKAWTSYLLYSWSTKSHPSEQKQSVCIGITPRQSMILHRSRTNRRRCHAGAYWRYRPVSQSRITLWRIQPHVLERKRGRRVKHPRRRLVRLTLHGDKEGNVLLPPGLDGGNSVEP